MDRRGAPRPQVLTRPSRESASHGRARAARPLLALPVSQGSYTRPVQNRDHPWVGCAMLVSSMIVTTIPVTDLDRATHFYAEALGLQVLCERPATVPFCCRGVQQH